MYITSSAYTSGESAEQYHWNNDLYSIPPTVKPSPAGAVHIEDETIQMYEGSYSYATVNLAKPNYPDSIPAYAIPTTAKPKSPSKTEECFPMYMCSDSYTAGNQPDGADSNIDANYSIPANFNAGQWLPSQGPAGLGGTKETMQGVRHKLGPTTPSFDEISYNTADPSTNYGDFGYAVAASRHEQTTTAATTSTNIDAWPYELEQKSDEDRHPTGHSSPNKHLASTSSRTVGNEVISSAQATTTTNDYELETRVNDYQMPARCAEQRQGASDAYCLETTATAAAASRGDYDDVTAMMVTTATTAQRT